MRAALCILLLSVLGDPVFAVDSNRIIALEQDVRNLERIVGNLEREVRELRRGTAQPSSRSVKQASPSESWSTDWVDAAKWKQVRMSMTELEVIAILGKPTSMRAEQDSTLLLYAMEIGTSGFLSGSVRLRGREVVEVELPTLK